MTNNQIMKEIDKAVKLGHKEAYVDMFCIVSDMRTNGKNSDENLNDLLNLLHKKVLFGKEGDKNDNRETL